MMKRFLKPKSNQNNPSQAEQDALLSPNLLSQDLLTQDTLNTAQRTFVTSCKVVTLIILLVFFVTLAFYYVKARSYSHRLQMLNNQAQELALYLPAETRITNLDKRIALHKKIAPVRKNFVDKVSATLERVGTNESLQDFTYKSGVLTLKIKRDDILDTTLLISDLVDQEYIDEIAILSADLNPAEEYYTVRLEIAYK